jgi:cell wall-associated NlpC family hydrolase
VLATGGVVLASPDASYAAPAAARGFQGGHAFVRFGQSTIPPSLTASFAGPAVPPSPKFARITHSYLAVDKATVLSGQSIVLAGRVTYGADERPIRSQPVRLEEGAAGSWKTVGNALANPDGSVTFTVKPAKSTNYRLNYGGMRALSSSVSPTQAVTVKVPPPPPPVVVRTVSSSSSTSSGGNWAPAGVSQIGSNGRSPSATALAVVAAAAAQSGKPYVFAAAGPNAFDCSGLTMFVFAQFGVRLPHLADSQKNYGTPVSAADAAPGDLMIFLDGGYGYHVAIYAGGATMYDAPNSNETVGRHTIWSTNVIFRRLV